MVYWFVNASRNCFSTYMVLVRNAAKKLEYVINVRNR